MNQFPSQGQTGSASNVPANPLGTLPINQLLARFAIPSIIAMLVSALYNIVDQFFIGRSVGMLGNAATNVAFPLTITCTALSLMFGIGGAANFNLSMGHGEREDAARYAGNAVFYRIDPLPGSTLIFKASHDSLWSHSRSFRLLSCIHRHYFPWFSIPDPYYWRL